MDAADIRGWLHIVNTIGDEGAKALGDGLKENKTLTLLNLESTSSFYGWIDVCIQLIICGWLQTIRLRWREQRLWVRV